MKKVNIILGILFLAIASVTLSGCGEKKKNSPLTGFEQAITNADSVEVTHLVNQFFEYAENGNYDAAAGMLYKDNVDSVYNEPQALDNKAMTDLEYIFPAHPKPQDRLHQVQGSIRQRGKVYSHHHAGTRQCARDQDRLLLQAY